MPGSEIRRASRRLPKPQLMLLLAVIGPGIIAANADNDASGIYGYSLAGAQYSYGLLWVLVLVTISLGVCQEMCARMGAVTGKGLADLIREEYGVRITLFAMVTLLVANFATTVSEFAGITAAVEVFRPGARFVVLPLTAIAVWYLVTRGTYRRVERFLLAASLIYGVYFVSAFMAHPPWGVVMHQTFWPQFKGIKVDKTYLFVVINIIGTTITPWGQFYIQSSVRDKGIRARDYGITRADVLFGAFFTNFIAFFIIVCCGATLGATFQHQGISADQIQDKFRDAGQIAQALRPLVGHYGKMATVLFALGLFNASLFGAITVPLSTAYAITESLGWESGLGRRARESQIFLNVFSFLLMISPLTVLLLGDKYLAQLIILPNIVGGILLPIILILMLKLINNKRLMVVDGVDYSNSRIYNVIAYTTTVVLIVLSVALLVSNFV
jgi:NRAMP (natural resistance-associated macrophage protein)-like metal ion transporter